MEANMNTWPQDIRRPLSQSEHVAWNARSYPGTRQTCSICDEPTGRCEDDSLLSASGETLCESCYQEETEPEPNQCCECDLESVGVDETGSPYCADH